MIDDSPKFKDAESYYLQIGTRLVEGPPAGSRAHFGKFAVLGLDLSVTPTPLGETGFNVRVDMHVVADAESGAVRPNSVSSIEYVRTSGDVKSLPPDLLRETILTMTTDLLRHELEEWLTIDGIRKPPEHDE